MVLQQFNFDTQIQLPSKEWVNAISIDDNGIIAFEGGNIHYDSLNVYNQLTIDGLIDGINYRTEESKYQY